MSCALTACITRDCRQNTGGIVRVYVTTLAQASATVTATGTTGAVQAISGNTGWYIYNFRKQTGTFTETLNASDENGTIFYAPEIVLQFSKLETYKRNELFLLAQNEVVMIVEDNNGSFWMAGLNNGLTVTAGTAVTGKAAGDLNGYTVTLNGAEPEPMLSVPANIVPSVTCA